MCCGVNDKDVNDNDVDDNDDDDNDVNDNDVVCLSPKWVKETPIGGRAFFSKVDQAGEDWFVIIVLTKIIGTGRRLL